MLPAVKEHYGIEFNEYGIVIFHPVTSELKTISSQASHLFSTLVEKQKNFVVVKPNNDPGCAEINRVIEKLPKENFRILSSLRFEYFSVFASKLRRFNRQLFSGC